MCAVHHCRYCQFLSGIKTIDIFKKGQNCWAIPTADRFGLMIDGANYYKALRSALLKAEKTVFLVGWDIDSRVRLMGDTPPDDGAPEYLRDLLEHLVEQKPDLRIHVLLWDFSVLYALERDPMPVLNLSWATPPRVEVCLDDIVPLGCSHHQKIIIIDGKIAFCGGLDLAIRRWDTREHDPDNEYRVEPDGSRYIPFHDMQCVVDGEAAAKLTELVVARWEQAACATPECPKSEGDPWPDGVEPLFTNHPVAIARTVPPLGTRAPAHEIEQLYLDTISTARTTIYMENQFFTSVSVAKALAQRLRENTDLEVILVSSKKPHGFLEAHSMATGLERFMGYLEEADALDRVRLVYPRVPDGTSNGQDVMVHAKLTIIDDHIFRVGSANVNNRSMGTDGECDLALEATTDDTCQKIMDIRNDLLAEHLGMSVAHVAEEIARHGNIRSLIDTRKDEPRTLALTEYKTNVHEHVASVVQAIADPERPGDASQFAGDMLSARPGNIPIRGRYLVLGGIGIIALLALIGFMLPFEKLDDASHMETLVTDIRNSMWAYVIVLSLFVMGSAFVIPVAAMIGVTAILFTPAQTIFLVYGGALLGATLTYALGTTIGKQSLRRVMGKRLNKISRALAERGVLTVVSMRLTPEIPFTFVNLVAGASRITFHSYVLGTIIGMAPVILVLTLIGDRINTVLADPTVPHVAGLAGAVALWFGILVGGRSLTGHVIRWVRGRAGESNDT